MHKYFDVYWKCQHKRPWTPRCLLLQNVTYLQKNILTKTIFFTFHGSHTFECYELTKNMGSTKRMSLPGCYWWAKAPAWRGYVHLILFLFYGTTVCEPHGSIITNCSELFVINFYYICLAYIWGQLASSKTFVHARKNCLTFYRNYRTWYFYYQKIFGFWLYIYFQRKVF